MTNQESAKEEVHDIMGGHVLDYETMEILNQGYTEAFRRGYAEGFRQGREEMLIRNLRLIIQAFQISPTQAMDALRIPKDQQDRYAELIKNSR